MAIDDKVNLNEIGTTYSAAHKAHKARAHHAASKEERLSKFPEGKGLFAQQLAKRDAGYLRRGISPEEWRNKGAYQGPPTEVPAMSEPGDPGYEEDDVMDA